MVKRACRNCRLLTNMDICPNCKKSTLSTDWVGEIIVVDPEKSSLAKRLGITQPGKYALRVR